MLQVSLLGIPHDDNSSFMKGAAEAPPLIRQKLYSDAYTEFSESGIDVGSAGRIHDRGDIRFDAAGEDPWDLIATPASPFSISMRVRISTMPIRAICARTHPPSPASWNSSSQTV